MPKGEILYEKDFWGVIIRTLYMLRGAKRSAIIRKNAEIAPRLHIRIPKLHQSKTANTKVLTVFFW